MRILIHTQYYPPEMGAPQARLSDLARRFKALGHDVEVLTAFPNYPTGKIFDGYAGLCSQEIRDGICVHRCWIFPSNRRSLAHRLVSYSSFCLSSFLVGSTRMPRADVVITESPPLFLAVAGWLLATLKGSRWILNVSDLWPDSAKYIGMVAENSPMFRILKGLAHFAYRRAWLVTGQSKEIVEEIRRQVPGVRLYHLSNGVDTRSFQPKHRRLKVRRRYGKDGEVCFVYAGLHGLFQGLDQILEAAERVRDEKVRFVFFGDGPEKKGLMHQAAEMNLDNVAFYPPIPHGEIPAVLASMDVAVVSLKSAIRGAVPSKIYEAMASGIPVMLVADGEAGQIVQKTKAGIAVNPGDLKGLTDSIRALVNRPEWRNELGKRGRAAALKYFDRSQIAKQFEDQL